MSGGRPSRGAKVRYREVDSDDSDYEYDEFTKVVTIEPINDNSDDEDYSPGDIGLITEEVPAPKVNNTNFFHIKIISTKHFLFPGSLPSTQSYPREAKESLQARR